MGIKGRKKITPEQRQKNLNIIKDIYDNAPKDAQTYLSDFRKHVMQVLQCTKNKAYSMICAFIEDYHVEFVKFKGKGKWLRTKEFCEKMSKVKTGSRHTEETKKKIGEHTTARQLGTTYSVTANGRHLGKKNLHDENEVFEQEFMLPVTKTRNMTIVIE